MRAAFTLLVGFSGLSVVLSFAGSDLLGPVTGSPAGARLGVFALTVAFTALVWERDRGLRRTAEQLTTERMLTSALESRLRALEALIAAGERLDVPLAMDDALRVVLEGAIDISGAAGGAGRFRTRGTGRPPAIRKPCRRRPARFGNARSGRGVDHLSARRKLRQVKVPFHRVPR